MRTHARARNRLAPPSCGRLQQPTPPPPSTLSAST